MFGGDPESGSPLSSDLPDYCAKPTLVLGCGNLFFGDDAFGCAAAEGLEKRGVPEDVCVLDVGTGARAVLFTILLSPARPRRILVVDAVDAGRSPGEVFEIRPSEIPYAKRDDFSLHQVPTSNLLADLEKECGVEVRVLACQSGPIPAEMRPGLSPAVAEAVPRAVEWVMRDYLGGAR